MENIHKFGVVEIPMTELTIIEGGSSGRSLTEWIYYGIGALIGGVEQTSRNAAESRFRDDQNTLFGHYGGARP